MDRFWKQVDRNGPIAASSGMTTPCWIWTGCLRDGYGRIQIDHVPVQAHRRSWILANGEIPIGMSVLHKCDVRRCVRPDHLFTGTLADNVADMIAKGRNARGDRSPAALHPKSMRRFGVANHRTKLTSEEVAEMRRLFATKSPEFRMIELGRKFGVAISTVSRIVRGLRRTS
jgi:hypothetical protein